MYEDLIAPSKFCVYGTFGFICDGFSINEDDWWGVFDSYADARAYVDRLFADCGIYDVASIGSTNFAGRKFYPRAIGDYRFPNDSRNDYPVFAIRIC